MKKEKIRVKCTHPHFFYDWDSMFITPLMPEFESCTCYCCGVGATSMKDFEGSRLEPYESKALQEWLDSRNESQ
jgi:hypothetical protein